MAARSGNPVLAGKALQAAKASNLKYIPNANTDMLLIAEAEMAIADRNGEKAIDLLANRAQQKNSLYLLHATLERAYLAVGKTQNADLMHKWLIQNRGRAYAEYSSDNFLLPINVYSYYLAAEKTKDKDS